MGAKDSKPSFITYEDAVKRVSDSELRRIKEAFKKCAGANGTVLSLDSFVHEVLCDGVPYEVAEWLYQASGGTKRGISFKDLLCGIVVFTKGNIEEKIKFLWVLYTNNQTDNGVYLHKRDFARTLHMENASLPPNGNHRSSEILLGLFGTGDRVTYDQFRSWLLIHKDATVLSKWLLSDVNNVQDLETPTFYQSLAGVTHLEERDIIELEKCFWTLRNNSSSGELDRESMVSLLSPYLPAAAALGVFLAFDENRDGQVDFKELCCGLSAACRGPTTERLKFCFKIFDQDGDGVLNMEELNQMVNIVCEVGNERARSQSSRASTPDLPHTEEPAYNPQTVLDYLKGKMVSSKKTVSTGDYEEIVDFEEESVPVLELDEFLLWCVESACGVWWLAARLHSLAHVLLGLRPHCAKHERDIVLGWLRECSGAEYRVGEFWYVVSSEWWGAWLQHAAQCVCACTHTLAPAHTRTDELACDDSFTTNSTESMGSAAWRCESASVCSGSSSGVGSAGGRGAPPPGPVDNSPLLAAPRPGPPGPAGPAPVALTGEGGALRRDTPLVQHTHFELLPAPLWRALAAWHGALNPLPRQVIRPPNSDVELELYPLQLLLYTHVPSTQKVSGGTNMGGYSMIGTPPERRLTYTAAFSRLATVKQVLEFICGCIGATYEEVRLWRLEAGGALGAVLGAEGGTLGGAGLRDGAALLLERARPDRTWPEELWALRRPPAPAPPAPPGHTGLHNLGNTCYMNAALQAVWNNPAVREYFRRGLHLYELNTTSPHGTKGALALRYGELCNEVWGGGARAVAPLRVRWCVSAWARALPAGAQHDAQELLAWLLDTLHEDLNRAPLCRPSAPLALAGGSEGDAEGGAAGGRGDAAGAAAAWAAHVARDWSLITDLFCGLLKSRVRCDHCHTESVKFEIFNMLSLPLPMDADITVICKVIRMDGSVPVRYGVKVPAEGTYRDVLQELEKLCNVPSDRMIVVEVSNHTISRVYSGSARVSAGHELTVYETPAHAHHHHQRHGASAGCGRTLGARRGGEVSVGDGAGSSLCMPALFCFKRSSADLVTSHSPPATFLRHGDEYRSNTLPKEFRRESGCGSPSPSVRSLPVTHSHSHSHTDSHSHRPSVVPQLPPPAPPPTYLVAVHRKQVRVESYFLWWQRVRPALFGVPLVVALPRGASGRRLHADVWTQVARLISAPPRPRLHNHATDCDDSLGYTFPFRLRVVNAAGTWCGVCAWTEHCRGCLIPDTDDALIVDEDDPDDSSDCSDDCCSEARTPDSNSPMVDYKSNKHNGRTDQDADGSVGGVVRRLSARRLRGAALGVEWEGGALHVRYCGRAERAAATHTSARAAPPHAGVALAAALRAFTAPERLEQRYLCAQCRSPQPATKSLQIWRLPPLLIIHLKRFQYVNNKWIKSQKMVDFPLEDFDPTEFLATVPQETILRHKEITQNLLRRPSTLDDAITESDSEDDNERESQAEEKKSRISKRRKSIEEKRRARLESTSLITTPVVDDNLIDFHEHKLVEGQDPFDLKYRLYAVVSHSGQLSGGHYVSYARNAHSAGGWVCYNDSAVSGVSARALDRGAAYLLLYERCGLDPERYMPDVSRRPPPHHTAHPPPGGDACVLT